MRSPAMANRLTEVFYVYRILSAKRPASVQPTAPTMAPLHNLPLVSVNWC